MRPSASATKGSCKGVGFSRSQAASFELDGESASFGKIRVAGKTAHKHLREIVGIDIERLLDVTSPDGDHACGG